jgi:hypothetical protein
MKQIFILVFVTMFSIVCHAQKDTFESNRSSAFILMPLNINSFQETNKSFIPENNYSLENNINPKRFTLYFNSYNTSAVLFDNNKHRYFVNNPLHPYHDYRSALLCGSLNYLFLLFEKK